MTGSAELSATARGSQRRAPDFFIVGHPKSGTTALYEMLRRHPQIFMPELKEPSFFGSEPAQSPGPGSAGQRDRLEEYLSLFDAAGPDQRFGEATPSYLKSGTAASRIAELQPDARIIAILREPASFLRSLHLQICAISYGDREGSGQGDRAGGRIAREGRDSSLVSAADLLCIPSTCATSSSCAATTPCFRPSRCSC